MKKIFFITFIALVLIALGCAWFASFRFKSTPRSDLKIDSQKSAVAITMLKKDVLELAGKIGARSTTHYENLIRASEYLQGRYSELGYEPRLQTYKAAGFDVSNIYAVKPSATPGAENLIIGAHYDTQYSNPGADDNASGVAVLLALMKSLSSTSLNKTIHFVCLVNEELPHSHSPAMGAFQYAKWVFEQKLPVAGMISLESVGYFDSSRGSQRYPFQFMSWLYPDRGDFIAVVGNLKSHNLVSSITRAFHESSPIQAEGAVLPQFIRDIARSDHWAFWKFGFEAVMITDTANFRNANYHKATDHPDTLNYEKIYEVYLGLNQFLANQ